jgi:hypothetical protein
MEPLVVSIPHNLGKEEAMRRLKEGLSKAATGVPLLKLDDPSWTDNRVAFRAHALGQTASGTIDVEDRFVRLEVVLPWMLAKLAGAISQAVNAKGRLLLEKH